MHTFHFFFFQAEDGIRDTDRSRGLGDVYKRQDYKGIFGKVYSRDMAWAASRYTEVRLDPICQELFRDIDQDAVDFVPNYDGKLTEPTLLPP